MPDARFVELSIRQWGIQWGIQDFRLKAFKVALMNRNIHKFDSTIIGLVLN